MSLDMLVFAAHPDDAEIGMGGTIIKHTNDGLRVGMIDLTYAEMSSNGDVDTRQREAGTASMLLGLTLRENLGLPDRGLTGDTVQIAAIVSAIRRHRPRTVFAPYGVDRHPDHVACSRMIEDAVFNAKLRRYNPEEPAWTVDMLYFYFINDVHPSPLLVDITDVQERKMQALSAYRSQFTPADTGEDWVATPLTDDYLERVVARDRLLGQPRRFAFAEAFVPKGPFAVQSF